MEPVIGKLKELYGGKFLRALDPHGEEASAEVVTKMETLERSALDGDDRAQVKFLSLLPEKFYVDDKKLEQVNQELAFLKGEGVEVREKHFPADHDEEYHWDASTTVEVNLAKLRQTHASMAQLQGVDPMSLPAPRRGMKELRYKTHSGKQDKLYLGGSNYFALPVNELPLAKRDAATIEEKLMKKGLIKDRDKLKEIEQGARRGVSEDAEILAYVYGSPSEYSYRWGGMLSSMGAVAKDESAIDVARFHIPLIEKRTPNPMYDKEKGKYWTAAAKVLKGEGTERENADFIRNVWEDPGSPVDPYFAGFTLIHGKMKDFRQGVSYLEKSANSGNSYAARELGEIFEGYDKEYAPEVFAVVPDAAKRLEMSYLWYRKAGDMGQSNGTARADRLRRHNPELAAFDDGRNPPSMGEETGWRDRHQNGPGNDKGGGRKL